MSARGQVSPGARPINSTENEKASRKWQEKNNQILTQHELHRALTRGGRLRWNCDPSLARVEIAHAQSKPFLDVERFQNAASFGCHGLFSHDPDPRLTAINGVPPQLNTSARFDNQNSMRASVRISGNESTAKHSFGTIFP